MSNNTTRSSELQENMTAQPAESPRFGDYPFGLAGDIISMNLFSPMQSGNPLVPGDASNMSFPITSPWKTVGADDNFSSFFSPSMFSPSPMIRRDYPYLDRNHGDTFASESSRLSDSFPGIIGASPKIGFDHSETGIAMTTADSLFSHISHGRLGDSSLYSSRGSTEQRNHTRPRTSRLKNKPPEEEDEPDSYPLQSEDSRSLESYSTNADDSHSPIRNYSKSEKKNSVSTTKKHSAHVFPSPHRIGKRIDLSKTKPEKCKSMNDPDDSDDLNFTQDTSLDVSNDSIKKDSIVCKCKKSKCLKLYCDCFAVMKYCDSSYCKCQGCHNQESKEVERQEAIKSTKERNPLAFQTKINDKDQHSVGCHCRNSKCLKKYCECFTLGAYCGANCKCQSCQNFSGSEKLVEVRSALGKPIEIGPNSAIKKRKDSPTSVTFLTSPNENSTTVGSVKKAKPSTPIVAIPPQQLKSTSKHGTPNVPKDKSNKIKNNPPLVSSRSTLLPSLRLISLKEEEPLDSADVKRRTRSSTLVPKIEVASMHPLKKRRVHFAPSPPIVYPFFGPTHPQMPKIIALQCLDFMKGKEIYAMSQVNSIWNQAAMDDALWEN